MPLHVPILLAVKSTQRAVAKLDEATAVGDPDYHERSQSKKFIPKLPAVLMNSSKKLFGTAPKLTAEQEAEWHAKAAAAHEEAEAKAAAAAEAKRQAKEAKRQAKEARRDFKEARKHSRYMAKEARKAAEAAAKAAKRAR